MCVYVQAVHIKATEKGVGSGMSCKGKDTKEESRHEVGQAGRQWQAGLGRYADMFEG